MLPPEAMLNATPMLPAFVPFRNSIPRSRYTYAVCPSTDATLVFSIYIVLTRSYQDDPYPSVGHIPECLKAPIKGAVQRQSFRERDVLGFIDIQLKGKSSAKDDAKEDLISSEQGAVQSLLDVKNGLGALVKLACRHWKQTETHVSNSPYPERKS